MISISLPLYPPLQYLRALAQDTPASSNQLPSSQRSHWPQRWLLHGAVPASLQKRRLLPVQQGFGIRVCLPAGPWSVQNDKHFLGVSSIFGIVHLSDCVCVSTAGQRFMQEFLTPYLQQAQEIWQWLLAAGLLGAAVAAIFAAVIVVVRRKWKRSQRRKRASSYGERQPLLHSSSEEGSSSYQTTL